MNGIPKDWVKRLLPPGFVPDRVLQLNADGTINVANIAAAADAVAAAETKTAGEIYCVLTPAVSDYRETPLAWATATALLARAIDASSAATRSSRSTGSISASNWPAFTRSPTSTATGSGSATASPSGSASVTLTGTLAQINALLAGSGGGTLTWADDAASAGTGRASHDAQPRAPPLFT